MRFLTPAIVLTGLLCASFAPQDQKPDVLELDNGRILKGKFESADGDTIKFRTAKAGVKDVPREMCVRLHFAREDDPGALEGQGNPRAQNQAARRQQQQGQKGPGREGKKAKVPAGTPITVVMEAEIRGSDPPGAFVTGNIASNVKAGGRVVIPAGSRAFGRVIETGDQIRMEFTEINVWGTSYPIHTTTQAGQTRSRMNAGAAGAASGAVIGQRIDGSSGWNDGAWVGAFIGRAVGQNMQDSEVIVDMGSVVEFRLNRPLHVTL